MVQEAAQVRDELKEVVMQQMEEAIAKTSSTAVTHGIKVCAKRCAGWLWARVRRPGPMSCSVAGKAVALKPLSHTGPQQALPNGFQGLLRNGKRPAQCMPLCARKPLTLKLHPLPACSYFVPENSRPERNRYFFAYKVGACIACLYFTFLLMAC